MLHDLSYRMNDSAILAINAGSSSVKTGLFTFGAEPRQLARRPSGGDPAAVLAEMDAAGRATLAGVGHRIVHGGTEYEAPILITGDVLEGLHRITRFAPNHLPAAIQLIEGVRARRPDLPQVACFDTAFHASLPSVARRLPIPARYDAAGVRRYGFHGLSCAYVVEQLRRLGPPGAEDARVVIAHLGNGSSLTAVRDGRSIDTTMGFTPLGGVMMSTRSGDIDPGAAAYMARVDRQDGDGLENLLGQESGLKGVSEISGDMRTLLQREETDAASRLAVAMFVYGVAKAIGSLAVALGGIDGLVFTGGIGEHSAVIRERICARLAFLGVDLAHPAGARVWVQVIPANEELMIAKTVYSVLTSRS